MFTLLQFSTGMIFGSLCVVAGFLIIVASVVFVIKGSLLQESGAERVQWGKIQASLTSAVALFVLGAALIALPFYFVVKEDAAREEAAAQLKRELAKQPPTAILNGEITGAEDRDIRLLLVEKPDYDQSYRGAIVWQFPFLAEKLSYSVLYIDGDTIVSQQSFSLDPAPPGSQPQKRTLPAIHLQTGKSHVREVTPQLEVSNAELKNLGVH